MDFITQEEAKIKIKEWLLAGETEAQIKTKLAEHGFVDIVIDNLLIQTRPKTAVNNYTAVVPQAVSSPTPDILSTKPILPQTQTQTSKNIFDFKNLKWYEWLVLLPAFLLLIQGGVLGGAVGILGWSWSLKIIRNESMSKIARLLCVIGVTIACYAVYFILSILFVGIIRGLISSR